MNCKKLFVARNYFDSREFDLLGTEYHVSHVNKESTYPCNK